MQITAKFNGKCVTCNGKLSKGSRINWSRGEGASHIQCDPNQIIKDGKTLGQLAEEWDIEHRDQPNLCDRMEQIMADAHGDLTEDAAFQYACQDHQRNPYR